MNPKKLLQRPCNGLSEARLIQHDQGVEAALAFLNQPTTMMSGFSVGNLLLWNLAAQKKSQMNLLCFCKRRKSPQAIFSSVLALAPTCSIRCCAADQTIRAALQKKPRHVTSRYVSAVVDIFAAFPHRFALAHLNFWPVPPPWNLVKRDAASRERRHRAAPIFEGTSQHSS